MASKRVTGPAPEGEEGRVLKVLLLDDQGEPVGEWHSNQIPEDPFQGMAGIQEPPFSMEQLVFLAEMHPVHASALDQKTADIMGKGWEWEPPEIKEEGTEEEAKPDEAARDDISNWFDSLADDDTSMEEIVAAAVLDKHTVGWGLIELARGLDGKIHKAYHVPAHTVRAHRDGVRLVQIRDNRKIWFQRWGVSDAMGEKIQVDAKTGSKTKITTPANELFVIKGTSRRSTWYGIPTYISAIGWITLSLAARDDNLQFFHNRREPRWAIILTGLQDDPDIEADLRRAFTVDLANPHRNILVPISGQGKVEFQKLSELQKDGSFDKLDERAGKHIMIAHRVPAERLANSQVGPLGGNATFAASRIYKEGVIAPEQEMLARRLNKLIEVEYQIATGNTAEWSLVMDDLDVQSDQEEVDLAVAKFKNNMCNLREAREMLKMGPLMDEDGEESIYNDYLFCELPTSAGGGGGETDPLAPPPGEMPDPTLGVLENDVQDLLTASREIHERLSELADDR